MTTGRPRGAETLRRRGGECAFERRARRRPASRVDNGRHGRLDQPQSCPLGSGRNPLADAGRRVGHRRTPPGESGVFRSHRCSCSERRRRVPLVSCSKPGPFSGAEPCRDEHAGAGTTTPGACRAPNRNADTALDQHLAGSSRWSWGSSPFQREEPQNLLRPSCQPC